MISLRVVCCFSTILCLLTSCALATKIWPQNSSPNFNVVNVGAVGDGETDDTKAFLAAWSQTCSTSYSSTPTMYIPANKIFLIKPAIFSGPCKASNIKIQIDGGILAPEVGKWDNNADTWLSFYGIDGLVFTGSGYIDGSGSGWWERTCKVSHKEGCHSSSPTEVEFSNCNNLVVSNLTLVNSQQMSLALLRSKDVYMIGINIKAPEYSPNTDGIHLAASQNVRIQDSSISTGDDCISIGTETTNVVIDGITCGPGHGIREILGCPGDRCPASLWVVHLPQDLCIIGSLGKDKSTATVEQISVSNSHFINTTNGARIKTWQGGKGYVRSISYENISFQNVSNPIIIDQYYCDTDHDCGTYNSAVQISDIKYSNFWGTSASNYAVMLNCSKTVACTGIQITNINITTVPSSDKNTEAVCTNAYGEADGYLNPDMSCLQYTDKR